MLNFDILRAKLFGGSLTQSQVDGINAVLTAVSEFPKAWKAYALATAFHETAATMQPISEYGGSAYFTRMYDITGTRPKLAKDNGNTTAGDGIKYHGRGYVQLTWKNNYAKAGKKLNLDLVNFPDMAKNKDVAASVLALGMKEGWFTGLSLANFVPSNRDGTKTEFRLARKIINGLDKADQIADKALIFQSAL